jgi:hypothetical protein
MGHCSGIEYGVFLRTPAQEDRKVKLQLHAQAAQQEENNASAKTVLEKTKKFCRQWGKRCSGQVAEKGTKRQRPYYDLTFGTDMPKQIVSSDAYFRQARFGSGDYLS